MTRFDPEKFYRPDDPAVRLIGTAGTLRVWRCKGRGPNFHKIGNRVYYQGVDLNRYLDSCAVNLTAA